MSDIAWIDTEQMREVDRLMIDEYRIELIQMMENAGRNLAHLGRTRFLGGRPAGKRVVVLAGPGGNGGGGLVCARRLHNWGARAAVYTAAGETVGVAGHQLDILRRMEVAVGTADGLSDETSVDLIVDAIIGYGLSGPPREPAATMIRWANAHDGPTLSLDTPSGLGSTSGIVHDPTVCATATMTLALPKHGLAGAERVVGELYLADIGVPPALYSRLGLEVGPLFEREEILRIG
jgi:NAD(P)H-hydrate epimerase